MSQFEEKSAYLALLSDVATVYTNILQYDELIKQQQNIVENYSKILKSDNKKFVRGIINTTDLNNSESNLSSSNIILENFIKQ